MLWDLILYRSRFTKGYGYCFKKFEGYRNIKVIIYTITDIILYVI